MTPTDLGPHAKAQTYTLGQPLDQAQAAMILLHGRGATAPGILELAGDLHHPDFAYLAPQAAGYTWYPYSFLSPIAQNEPGLSSALNLLGRLVAQIEASGIPAPRIVLAGFSQGACLVSEFVARNARRYGGMLVFSGGVIGPPGTPRDYAGSLDGTPTFLGCSDVDPHIPIERVEETADVFIRLGAMVDKVIYPGMGHTIVDDEIERSNRFLELVL
jgi:predicted esterase